jgi:colanic acid/amylovoran biosynthesis protein
MHATIAALSSGVPTIPLAYSPKFRGVFTAVKYPLVSDLASQDIEGVLEDTENALEALPDLRAAAAASNAIAQTQLNRYQEYLTEMMQSMP